MRENAVIQAFRAVADVQPEGVDLLVAEAGALVDAEDAAAAQRRPRDAGAGRDRLAGVELQMLALVVADEVLRVKLGGRRIIKRHTDERRQFH
ncbi:hypothetical protein, partial [Pseudomonas aeruginosa]|uniref:hypothetical protein n=1 Tax=Pseudomonas aeruginosa TaxID=287 RepID=UPI001C4A3A53